MKRTLLAIGAVSLIGIGIAYAQAVLRYECQGGCIAVGSTGYIDFETGAELRIAGTAVTSSAAELNGIDGLTASVADLNATTNFEETISATTAEVTITATKTLDIATAGNLQIANVAVTATAAELNYLDIAALGTGAASKAVVLDTGDDYTWPATGVLTYGSTGITANGAELNYLDLTALGTGAASKAVVLDAGEDYVWPATGILTYGVLKDPAATTITSTGAEINLLDGAVATNSVASIVPLLDSDKRIQTNSNNGTVETGVAAVHYGDGMSVTAVLTLTNVVLAVGTSENLGVGALIYTLPSGANLVRDAYMSVDFSGVSTTTDTPEIGLGTVIASGVVTALNGTATFEDIITGQVAADTNGTATVKGAGPTASAPLEITTAGAHTIHVNMADGWGANADQSGLLNGTVVISYIRQAP